MHLTQAALRTTAIYVVFAALWIIFSDHFLEALAPSESVAPLQTTKGLLFVLITAVLLFSLIKSQMRSTFSSEAQLRAVFESIAEGLIILDEYQNVVHLNDAALSLLGVDPAEKSKLLRPLQEIARDFDLRETTGRPAEEQQYTAKALSGTTIRNKELVLHRSNGTAVHLEISVNPIVRRDSHVIGAAIVIRDVTEMNRLQKLRDEFLATAAHEFKTPLAVIKANAQILRTSAAKWPEEKRNLCLTMIDRQCQKTNRLIQDLLIGSRLDRHSPDISKTEFDLVDLTNNVVEGLQQLSAKHRITLKQPPANTFTRVEGDRERIEQVLVNLIENAIKYSPAGGEINVTLYREGPRIWTAIQDSGIGIAKEKQQHVFEKYYSAHSGTPHDYGGLGIGLSLSKESILRHGGAIEFESKEKVGSTFRFALPVAHEVRNERSA